MTPESASETTAQRFARLRPLTPPCVTNGALRRRIIRGYSDRRCVLPAMTRAQAGTISGRLGAQRVRERYGAPVHLPGTLPPRTP